MSAETAWPPPGNALLPLLGLSASAEVVADPGAYLRPGRDPHEADTLVARTAWLIADAPGADGRFTPFARVHWADLPHDVQAVAEVVAPLCRSAERLHALSRA